MGSISSCCKSDDAVGVESFARGSRKPGATNNGNGEEENPASYSSGEDSWSEENVQQMIDLWQLNEKDAQRLRRAKKKLKHINHKWNTPYIAGAFIATGNGKNLDRTMKKMVEWRRKNNIDRMLTEYKPSKVLWDYTPFAFLKDYDKDGDPIYVERGGAIDALGMLQRFSREEIHEYIIWLREVQSNGEWLQEYERRQGRKMTYFTIVYDLEGLSSMHMNPRVINLFKFYVDITLAYYPVPLKRIILIRAPSIFNAVWRAVKNFFDEDLIDRMIFTKPDNYLDILSQYMDLDVLPPCINPKGHGETAVGMPKRMEGGQIPDYVGKRGEGYVSSGSTTVTASPEGEPSSKTNSESSKSHHEQNTEEKKGTGGSENEDENDENDGNDESGNAVNCFEALMPSNVLGEIPDRI